MNSYMHVRNSKQMIWIITKFKGCIHNEGKQMSFALIFLKGYDKSFNGCCSYFDTIGIKVVSVLKSPITFLLCTP